MDGGVALSVVDEALELADCRMVDLDAARRVPRSCRRSTLEEFDEDDLGMRQFAACAQQFPPRWVATDVTPPSAALTRVEPVRRGGDPGQGLAATVQDPSGCSRASGSSGS